MDNHSKATFNKGLTIFNLLLAQFGVVIFLIAVFTHFVFQSPYLLWELIVKLIILIMTIVFYFLYKRSNLSSEEKLKYKFYLSGFTIFSIEIAILYGYLYLIGV